MTDSNLWPGATLPPFWSLVRCSAPRPATWPGNYNQGTRAIGAGTPQSCGLLRQSGQYQVFDVSRRVLSVALEPTGNGGDNATVGNWQPRRFMQQPYRRASPYGDAVWRNPPRAYGKTLRTRL